MDELEIVPLETGEVAVLDTTKPEDEQIVFTANTWTEAQGYIWDAGGEG